MEFKSSEDFLDPKYRHNFEVKNNYKIEKFMQHVNAERQDR